MWQTGRRSTCYICCPHLPIQRPREGPGTAAHAAHEARLPRGFLLYASRPRSDHGAVGTQSSWCRPLSLQASCIRTGKALCSAAQAAGSSLHREALREGKALRTDTVMDSRRVRIAKTGRAGLGNRAVIPHHRSAQLLSPLLTPVARRSAVSGVTALLCSRCSAGLFWFWNWFQSH